MKKLNIYIIKQYIGTFIFTFFVAIFILLMQFLWTWVDEFIGKGVEFAVMFKLLFYTSVTFVPMALPLAILLSSLMCFGNLGEYYELVAMKASGISTWKVMRPLLYFSLTMSVLGFFFSNNVMPVANLKMQSTLYDVSHKKMTLEIPEGVFYRGIDKYVIKVAKKSKDGNWMYDVMIYDHTDGKGNVKVTVADSGYIYTSLDLLESVMQQIPSQQVLDEFEHNANPRYAETQESIITLIGKILGTAKNYFPQQVNAFLTKDIVNLPFPGIDKYKDEILGYNPGGERLSDLFTHKFGNMVIYTLIHEEVIDDVAVSALQASAKYTGSYKWFEEVVRIGLNKMFNLRL